jgi:hypothetical protein
MNNLVNAATQRKWELQAYGGYKDEILDSIKDSITFKLSGPGMVAASYLSDAQEVLQGNPEAARQYINIAKLIMFEFELGFNGR